jgi:hypothetical protein
MVVHISNKMTCSEIQIIGSKWLSAQPNFGINCDKHPADYCVIFYGSEVISVFNFVVGYLRVMRVVRNLSHEITFVHNSI